jgi:hypothetical protein
MTGGDFVRNVKQVIDLLRQIATVAPLPETRSAAERAASRLLRGVVAASAQVSIAPPVSVEATTTAVDENPDLDRAGRSQTIHAREPNAS